MAMKPKHAWTKKHNAAKSNGQDPPVLMDMTQETLNGARSKVQGPPIRMNVTRDSPDPSPAQTPYPASSPVMPSKGRTGRAADQASATDMAQLPPVHCSALSASVLRDNRIFATQAEVERALYGDAPLLSSLGASILAQQRSSGRFRPPAGTMAPANDRKNVPTVRYLRPVNPPPLIPVDEFFSRRRHPAGPNGSFVTNEESDTSEPLMLPLKAKEDQGPSASQRVGSPDSNDVDMADNRQKGGKQTPRAQREAPGDALRRTGRRLASLSRSMGRGGSKKLFHDYELVMDSSDESVFNGIKTFIHRLFSH